MDNIEIEIVNIFLSEAEMKHINITSPLCIFHSQLPSHSFSAKSCPDYLSRNLKQHYDYNHRGNVLEHLKGGFPFIKNAFSIIVNSNTYLLSTSTSASML